MTNRKSRRAAKVTATTTGSTIPNISGDDRSCANCTFSVRNAPKMWEAYKVSQRLHNSPLAPEDETLCMAGPGQPQGMKTWGFCYRWQAKDVVPE